MSLQPTPWPQVVWIKLHSTLSHLDCGNHASGHGHAGGAFRRFVAGISLGGLSVQNLLKFKSPFETLTIKNSFQNTKETKPQKRKTLSETAQKPSKTPKNPSQNPRNTLSETSKKYFCQNCRNVGPFRDPRFQFYHVFSGRGSKKRKRISWRLRIALGLFHVKHLTRPHTTASWQAFSSRIVKYPKDLNW